MEINMTPTSDAAPEARKDKEQRLLRKLKKSAPNIIFEIVDPKKIAKEYRDTKNIYFKAGFNHPNGTYYGSVVPIREASIDDSDLVDALTQQLEAVRESKLKNE